MYCECDGDAPSVLREQDVTARKEYKCCECGAPIQKGDRYRYTWGVWDGEPSTFRQCEKCADLWDSMLAIGYCITYGGLHELHREHVHNTAA